MKTQVNNQTKITDDGKLTIALLQKKSKALNKATKSHTMLAQDSFLGSLLVLPVELWNGIAG